MQFIADQKKDKEEALAAQAAREAAEREKNKPPAAELDFFGDPEAAIDAKLSPIVAQNINLTSRMLRKEIFEADGQFEYYTGDVKQKVDAFIDGLPLAQRANPASIRNCYFVVMGQQMKEVQEGKLKSRFASVSTPGNGTGAGGGEPEDKVTLSDEEKRVAQQFGISEEAYAKNRRETNYV
jgi:hypothetical protein